MTLNTLFAAAQAVADTTAAAPELMQQILDSPPTVQSAMWAGGLLAVAWLAHFITRRVLLRLVYRITERTAVTWDDQLRNQRFFRHLASAAPLFVIYFGIYLIPDVIPALLDVVHRALLALITIMMAVAVGSFLSAVNAIYVSEYAHAHSRPIKGYLQIAKLVIWFAAIITVLSLLMGRSPVFFLSGMGALMAVVLLIFRTTILSLVASIQIATNDMVRVGDWISMPELGADGDVIDIALHTVKVQNWDKTITMIPTHRLVEDSFKNWRGMSESGGRRMKRSLHLDLNTVRFLTAEEIEELSKYELLASHMAEMRELLASYKGMLTDRTDAVQPTHQGLTNIGTFRAYMLAYLRAHPGIHQDMTLLVRQLDSGPEGVPLEVYCFASDTAWANYEGLQADLFDHFMAIAPKFGLRIFQSPAGSDFRSLVAPRD